MSGWFSRTSKTLPDCTGPFSVGCADIMFAQSESLKFGSFIRLFYPTSPKSNDSASNPKQALWCPRTEYSNGLASFINMGSWLFGKLIHWTVGNLVIPAISNAPLISGQDDCQGMPCIVFSHGLGGNRFMYSTYCCELASHGCLVAMVEHRDKSACASYILKETDSGEQAEEWLSFYKKTDKDDEFKLRNTQVCQRRDECISAMDILEHLQDASLPKNLMPSTQDFDLQQFKGRLDLERCAVLGHSFGGATVVATLAKEKRFRCGIALDVWMLPLGNEIQNEEINQPLLFINTYHFHKWKENADELKKLIDVEKDTRPVIAVKYAFDISEQLNVLRKTNHMSQSDVVFVFRSYLSWFSTWKADNLDSELSDSIYKKAIWVFLCRKLGIGDPPTNDTVLDGGDEHVIIGFHDANITKSQPSQL